MCERKTWVDAYGAGQNFSEFCLGSSGFRPLRPQIPKELLNSNHQVLLCASARCSEFKTSRRAAEAQRFLMRVWIGAGCVDSRVPSSVGYSLLAVGYSICLANVVSSGFA